MLVICVLFSAC